MTILTFAHRVRLAARVIGVYWLLVLGGLTVLTLDRLGDPAVDLTTLWFGAVAGTALGQLLALRNFRPWLAAVIIGVATYFTVPLMAAGFDLSLWKVFIPAALCGLWSLGDRSALIAFWFPTVVWMLSILDRTTGALTMDRGGAGLLGALAVGCILLLRAREIRRVGLWRAVSVMPLAPTHAPTVSKAPPGHGVARAGWTLAVTAITVAITAWIAPRLWQLEPLRGDDIVVPELVASGDAGETDLPCCPVAHHREVPRARIKEYLDLGRGHAGEPGALDEDPDDPVCRACGATVAVDEGGDLPAISMTTTTTPTSAAPPIELPPIAVRVAAAPVVAEIPPPVVSAPTVAPAPVVTPPVATPTVVAASPVVAAPPPPPSPPHAIAPATSPTRAHTVPPRHGVTWWPWLVALASGALVFQVVALGLRPLRRLIILRHLRRPFWDETIDQRVSNAWQLALIGLCDAGWRPTAREAPRELAARVGIDGVEACAVILERARHGLSVDAGDLAEIDRQANVAYASARGKLAAWPRALGWLRWPLT
jgi:hypothetical protein